MRPALRNLALTAHVTSSVGWLGTAATFQALAFTQTLNSLGHLAADPTSSMSELRNLQQSPVLHSGAGLLGLLAATILAVYKPWGLTPYGPRARRTGVGLESISSTSTPRGLYLLLGIVCLVLVFLVLHLIGGGPRGH